LHSPQRRGDCREGIIFDLVVRGHQIKSPLPIRHVYGHRPGASGESASHRFSRKETSSLSGLCASNESTLEDEWAVKKGFENVNDLLLPAIT
jgi:hypothetical protein